MGKIFCLMGKSSSGKDTIYNMIIKDASLGLKPIVLYTTRPIRDGEKNGETYHFVTDEEYFDLEKKGLIIESRVYHTVHGDWRYFTVNDENINLNEDSYLVIGTLEAYEAFNKYFEKGTVIPLFIEVDDGIRLQRALQRELKPENRKFAEMCRRFLADAEDFSEEKIALAGLTADNRFVNEDKEKCFEAVKQRIVTEKTAK